MAAAHRRHRHRTPARRHRPSCAGGRTGRPHGGSTRPGSRHRHALRCPRRHRRRHGFTPRSPVACQSGDRALGYRSDRTVVHRQSCNSRAFGRPRGDLRSRRRRAADLEQGTRPVDGPRRTARSGRVLPRFRPRAHRRRVGDARPDVERALLAQDIPGAHQHTGRHPDSATPPATPRVHRRHRSTVRRQRVRRQRWHCHLPPRHDGRSEGRNAQPPFCHRTLRRRQHRRGWRDPRRDGHGPRPDRDHRHPVLRPHRHTRRRTARGCAAPTPRPVGCHRRCGGLRQQDRTTHRGRCGHLRPGLHRQPVGLCRVHRCRRCCSAAARSAARRSRRGDGWPHRSRRPARRHVLQRDDGCHHRRRRWCQRADRRPDRGEAGDRRHARAARALHSRHRLRRGRLVQRRW
ncbi:unannotated protein [freshwater metagenome]|uniref:Unannotated protein n=1 Tax=freshwater metagenome TaxID=449393 RepID=A0A6J7AR60_9ZZZZ